MAVVNRHSGVFRLRKRREYGVFLVGKRPTQTTDKRDEPTVNTAPQFVFFGGAPRPQKITNRAV